MIFLSLFYVINIFYIKSFRLLILFILDQAIFFLSILNFQVVSYLGYSFHKLWIQSYMDFPIFLGQQQLFLYRLV